MDHATAVRIANSGQGAIVAELLRLSSELKTAEERIKRLTEIIEESWIRHEKRLALYLRDGLACGWCGSPHRD